MNILEQLEAEKAAAGKLVEKGGPDGSNLTEKEMKELRNHYEKAKSLKERVELFKGVNDLNFDGANPAARRGGASAHLSLRSLANEIPKEIISYSGRFGVKGLLQSGRTLLPVPIINNAEPIPTIDAEIPPRLVDYLPAVGRKEPVYDILFETTPEEDSGGAAVVPEGAEKPVKRLGLKFKTQNLKVVAVLSDELDKFVLQDFSAIRTWLGNRLTLEVINAVEDEILHGDGSDKHLLGLDHIEGVQTQEWGGNILDTVMLGVNKVESVGVAAQLIALSTTDWMNAQRWKDAEGRYYMSPSIIDPVGRTMFGYQVVQVPGLEAGTGWVIGAGSVALSFGEEMHIEWNPYSGFTRNTIRARVENRYALDVFRAHGLVKLDLSGQTDTTGIAKTLRVDAAK
ncbi:phage major capsid protein [Bifidobacterium callitrichidarum]|uniref:Phage major capsid protein n=1 Tax=Bifidobacterium callitrichidarum TaxID=2052941 RepID=A0A2U2N3P6_9BIFI|nr:phage major capsid protein [Bifidobacterium callitrichidarum]PWG63845.1 phage major capsid protein [Bifidobacterium callitrichidarum]